jgi:crossover junction endodeoxyribonuclease RusA
MFDVTARPRAQGNHRVSPQGKIYEQRSAALRDWREAVAWCARAEMRRRVPSSGPVSVHLSFRLPAPRRAVRPLPTTRPDLDKLTRAVLDALTGICFFDDSQVTSLWAQKVYGPPGCHIEIRDVDEVPA